MSNKSDHYCQTSEAWNLIVVVVNNQNVLGLPEHIDYCLYIIQT